ncbi:hypothetical protein PsYK624_157330 [Phanerochaete sordida]|uniref:Uncharacterized protein n=1 Tax=Phanerochaete sordida TaxID=48140 RepID=A0A9P3GTK1_9APHY|nr:hypothetical protein PsYK624_157330 [Phanerochaete sordida]
MEHYPRPHPHSAPLQTCNNLNDKQRSRLVRSTRKLGAVLGATPQLAENIESPWDSRRPSHVALPHSEPSSSASSIRSAESTYPLVKPTRRHASVSESPTRADLYGCPSSASSTLSLALPPSRTSSLDARSRKPSMKFGRTRTKSKPAPPDAPRPLVLRLAAVPFAPSPKTPTGPGALLAAPPTPRTPGTPSSLGSATPTPTPTTPVFPSAAETRRRRMAKLTRTLGELIPPHLVLGARRPAPVEPEGGVVVCIEGDAKPADLVPFELAPAPRTRQRRSMSVDLGAQGVPAYARSSRVWATGNNSTWRGEWNRKDIREVQHGLRSLKAR